MIVIVIVTVIVFFFVLVLIVIVVSGLVSFFYFCIFSLLCFKFLFQLYEHFSENRETFKLEQLFHHTGVNLRYIGDVIKVLDDPKQFRGLFYFCFISVLFLLSLFLSSFSLIFILLM